MVAEAQKGGLRLTAVDETATAEGLVVGMTLADARARTPALTVAKADPAADLALLMRLAEACRRLTPSLALAVPDGVDLDVSGCAALFGGEARLLAAAGSLAARLGLTLRAALADTPAQAYAAARYGGGGVVAAGAAAAMLAPLPVEALRLDPQGCTVLRQLGFRRIGQILALPRAALARRLGPQALERLDEALGARAAPLELSLEPPVFRAERRLFEPISEAEQVLQVARDLAVDLAATLDGRAVGGRGFALELFRVDGTLKRLCVASSRPLRHPAAITALFAERLAGLGDGTDEGLQADFGFDQLRLTALRTEPVQAAPTDLLAETSPPGAVEALADRIAARGAARASRLVPVNAHAPQAAEALATLAATGPAPLSAAGWLGAPARYLDTPLRPLRLFRPPQPIEAPLFVLPDGPPARFTWRRVTRTVVRAEGPERLEPEWGSQPQATAVRDYYRLEDEQGRRYWVFRQHRYDPPATAQRPEAREEIKPVRPPPKPAPRLQLVSPSPSPLRGGSGWGDASGKGRGGGNVPPPRPSPQGGGRHCTFARLVPARAVRMSPVPQPYAELAAATCFSFLRGASEPEDLLETALELGHAGMATTDRNTLAGVVRPWSRLKSLKAQALEAGDAALQARLEGFKSVVGARLAFADGTPDVLAYPLHREGYGRLSRLLTPRQLEGEEGRVHPGAGRPDAGGRRAGTVARPARAALRGGAAPGARRLVPGSSGNGLAGGGHGVRPRRCAAGGCAGGTGRGRGDAADGG